MKLDALPDSRHTLTHLVFNHHGHLLEHRSRVMAAHKADHEQPVKRKLKLSDLNSIGVNQEFILKSRPVLSHLPRDV